MQNNTTVKVIKQLLRGALRILPLTFWILLIFGFDSPLTAILTILCAVIHECGHIMGYRIFGMPSALGNSLSGFRLKSNRILSYREELVVSAAGPAINLILSIPCLAFGEELNGYIGLFGVFNLLTAISNLLPIKGYDGYRILSCALSIFGNADKREMILGKISLTTTAILSFLSLYLILVSNSGYWIYFVLLSCLFKSLGDREGLFARKREKTRELKSK